MSKPVVLFVGGFKSVSADGSYGGQVFACRSLIESDLRNHVTFILLDTTADGVEVRSILIRTYHAIQRIVKLLVLLSTRRIDHVLVFCSSGFSFFEKGIMVMIAKAYRKKTMLAPRSGLLQGQLTRRYRFRQFAKRVIRASDTVICQGEQWFTFFDSMFPGHSGKFLIQLNWIDLSAYPYHPQSAKDLVRLLFIGQFHPYKGLMDLLEAVRHVRELPLQLSIYGGGKLQSEYEHFVDANDLSAIVSFKGWADQQTKLEALAQADVLILPSHAEGMPNVVLEAMASGVPVIATRVGGIPSLIHSGTSGILVEPGKAEQLADAIRLLVTQPDLRQQLSATAHTVVAAECSIDKAAEKIRAKILVHV